MRSSYMNFDQDTIDKFVFSNDFLKIVKSIPLEIGKEKSSSDILALTISIITSAADATRNLKQFIFALIISL